MRRVHYRKRIAIPANKEASVKTLVLMADLASNVHLTDVGFQESQVHSVGDQDEAMALNPVYVFPGHEDDHRYNCTCPLI